MSLLRLLHYTTGILLLTLAFASWALTDEEAERLFNDDWEQRAAAVNEGQLVFFKDQQPNVHHHHNSLIITPSSIKDGWIGLRQCHENLDPVSALEIVFRPERIRDLTIESHANVEKVWIEGASVQMQNVGAHAAVCIRATALALQKEGEGYVLRSGPFMRKFLDGYYPMRVSVDITYPETYLRFANVTPSAQPGFMLRQQPNSVHLEAVFEGRLNTEVHFQSIIN